MRCWFAFALRELCVTMCHPARTCTQTYTHMHTCTRTRTCTKAQKHTLTAVNPALPHATDERSRLLMAVWVAAPALMATSYVHCYWEPRAGVDGNAEVSVDGSMVAAPALMATSYVHCYWEPRAGVDGNAEASLDAVSDETCVLGHWLCWRPLHFRC